MEDELEESVEGNDEEKEEDEELVNALAVSTWAGGGGGDAGGGGGGGAELEAEAEEELAFCRAFSSIILVHLRLQASLCWSYSRLVRFCLHRGHGRRSSVRCRFGGGC